MTIRSILRSVIWTTLLFSVMFHCQAQSKPKSLEINRLTGDFYIYTTYSNYNGQPFPSNSMYVVTTEGVVLIDTPWDPAQFQPLLDSIKKRHDKKVVLCIATHFHADRTAGLEFYKNLGIATYTSTHTHKLSIDRKEKLAGHHFSKDTTFVVGDHSFSTYYPGEGHSPDNVLVWFPGEKVLYGGCFVKSADNTSIGNIADANVKAWDVSVTNTIKKFPSPSFVIPGHLSWLSKDNLKHTLMLIRNHKN
jgi:metallo-beta-lactamase class B